MKTWQRAAAALAERPRSLLELAAAIGSSVQVARIALNTLRHARLLVQTGEVFSLTPPGAAYTREMHPEDSPSDVDPRARHDVDALVAHAIATQPTSVFSLAPGSRPKQPA